MFITIYKITKIVRAIWLVKTYGSLYRKTRPKERGIKTTSHRQNRLMICKQQFLERLKNGTIYLSSP